MCEPPAARNRGVELSTGLAPSLANRRRARLGSRGDLWTQPQRLSRPLAQCA